ncbi:MAG TPA: PKD domain-containing protein [Chthoniobacterales bacterium]|nr:PKD domain-containing protein [Chthoniobacterales bacterium]
MFTVNAASVAATKRVYIQVSWPTSANDYDTFLEDAGHNLVAANLSTAEPEAIIVPVPADGTVYHLVVVNAVGGPGDTITGNISLQDIPSNTLQGPGVPPRYMNYPAGPSQANDAGEPSIGVDWNPNVATLKHNQVNTGGVAFFTSGNHEWRANFDDCSSPAINLWENVSSTFTQTTAFVDPIGFVDHYSATPLGLSYPPPLTPGRVFTIDLIGLQGNSLGGYSDTDGNSYLPGGNGGAPAGPDHETLGGGPYKTNATPPPPPHPTYANAIYYASQNAAVEAECSRSDDGGATFGPGIPIFNPQQCLGAIHGHIKVSPQGTVYIPNSSCGVGGVDGAAVSKDNGLTWNEFNVPNSGGSQDPSLGIGQNNVGKPPGQVPNTIYLGWIDSDNHAHISHSGDEGATWSPSIDVSSILGVQSACFPVVVAGDDNRAAFGFLGTTTPGAGAFSDLNFHGIWHMYIATTYDGGNTYILVDATPNDPVQTGEVCLAGLSCPTTPVDPRNLLDFNDVNVDAEGRVVLAYADGCVNCTNTYVSQSQSSHGTIARQSGGRRLFAAFDPVEPGLPGAPQLVSVVRQGGATPGVLVSWLEPDNGGSPITGYKVYRSTTSGTETFLASVSGNTNTKYLDQTANSSTNYFYRVTALNDFNGDSIPDEGPFCRELSVSGGGGGTACEAPYLPVAPAGHAGNISPDPSQGELTIQNINMGEPFTSCADNSITFVMKVNTLDPGNTGSPVLPANSEWQILFKVIDTNGNPETVFVSMDTFPGSGTPAAPNIQYGRRDPCSMTCGTNDTAECFTQPNPPFSCPKITASFDKNGTITFKLDVSTPLTFAAPGTPAVGTAFTWDARSPGTVLGVIPPATGTPVTGNTFLLAGVFLETVQTTSGGGYTRVGNQSCIGGLPIARLSGMPTSGKAPLLVNFDASTSSDSNPCATINSYTLDFGDGSAPVTQASPMFSHTYNGNGDFPAKLTVKDTAGLTSTNVAQVVIQVGSTFNKAVSHKVHALAGPFDIDLPLTGVPGNECRSGGPNNDYTIIYTFDRGLFSVGGVTVSHGVGGGTGSVSSQTFGPNANQYTVSITNVSNAQHLSVTLNDVHDSAGAVLNNSIARMGVLVGDVDASGRVDSTDVFQVRQQTLQNANANNFRTDVDESGRIDSTDVFITRQQTLTSLP